jgi:broad specificity phosphatase PhoE
MAKSNEIRVLLMRTGETEWEQAGRIAGSSDVPLSQSGLAAVKDAAGRLRAEGARISTVICGPDEASQATARELAVAEGAKVKVVEGLGEMNLGLWEGRLAYELEQACPTAYRQWLQDPSAVRAPEGETMDEAQDRILEALCKAVDKARPDHGAIAFVLRPVALGLVRCALGGVPASGLWSMMNGEIAQWKTIQKGLLRRSFERARLGA